MVLRWCGCGVIQGQAFAPDQAEIAIDDATAISEVTLSASLGACLGCSRAGCAFPGAGVERTLATFVAGAPKRARTTARERGFRKVYGVGASGSLGGFGRRPGRPISERRGRKPPTPFKSCRLGRSDIESEGWRGSAAAQARREVAQRVTTWRQPSWLRDGLTSDRSVPSGSVRRSSGLRAECGLSQRRRSGLRE